MQSEKMIFLGGGNMTRAIISGLIKNHYPPKKIIVIDRNPEKCAFFTEHFGMTANSNLQDHLPEAGVIILAIKPQDAKTACPSIQAHCKTHSPLILSIMAGLTVNTLSEWLGEKLAIIRAMPNTPSAIQDGAAGLFANRHCTPAQKNQAESILRATGVISWVDTEPDLATITALSGSGSGYYFYFMEIMEAVAIKMGISADTAHLFAAQTAYGAAKLALESPESFAQLRGHVTSKGGSTAAAIASMQTNHLTNVLENAMIACRDRALELAKGS